MAERKRLVLDANILFENDQALPCKNIGFQGVEGHLLSISHGRSIWRALDIGLEAKEIIKLFPLVSLATASDGKEPWG